MAWRADGSAAPPGERTTSARASTKAPPATATATGILPAEDIQQTVRVDSAGRGFSPAAQAAIRRLRELGSGIIGSAPKTPKPGTMSPGVASQSPYWPGTDNALSDGRALFPGAQGPL